jgi:hypothetical protein
MEPCGIARRGIHFALSVFLLSLLACGGGGTIGPQNQPQVTNAVDDFQFQATNLNNVTQTILYTWQNTGTQANVNQATAITAGSATLRIRDAAGSQVYSNSLAANGTQATSAGTTGNWAIEVVLSNVSGTINFRVQKRP